MIRLHVSSRLISWPPCCACCLGPAETTQPVRAERSKRARGGEWEVPYCHRCVNHQDAWREVGHCCSRLGHAEGQRTGGIIAVVVLAMLCLSCPFSYFLGTHDPLDRPEVTREAPSDDLSSEERAWVGVVGGMVCAGVVWPGGAFASWLILRNTSRNVRRCRAKLDAATDEAEDLMRRGCACEGGAVEYERREDSAHAFAFASKGYASAFSEANGSNVVR